jgi:hypothetical protein
MAAVAAVDHKAAPGGAGFSATWLAFLICVAIQLWLVWTHAPWIDEEQALLIARAPFGDLFHTLKFEGHGALWYIYLGLIDRIDGGSPWSLPLAQTIVSVATLFLIWFRSPFTWPIKLVIALNYYVFFEFGVISREYGLAALLVLSAAAFPSAVISGLVLALAANTCAQAAVVACLLGGVLTLRDKKITRLALVGMGVIAAALTVFPVASALYPTGGKPSADHVLGMLAGLNNLAFLAAPVVDFAPFKWSAPFPILIGLPAGLVATAMVALAPASTISRIAILAACVVLVAMNISIYQLSPRHVGIVAIMVIACLWLEATDGERLRKIAIVWLAVLILPNMVAAASVNRPFSHSLDVVAWIRSHGLAHEVWGAWPGRDGLMISTELGSPTVNLEKDCVNTFILWDYPHEDVPNPMAHILRDNVRYVISEAKLSGRPLAYFPSGYAFDPPVTLYAFKPDLAPLRTRCRRAP